jgi:hypothetical protein
VWNGQRARIECGRSWVQSSGGSKLVCDVSPVSLHHERVNTKTDCQDNVSDWSDIVRIMCPTGATLSG